MTWATKYLGLEFSDEMNCWALVCRVFKAECGIDLDPFAGIGAFDSPAVAEKVSAQLARNDWLPISFAAARPFDVGLMWVERRLMGRNTARTLSHIGIVAAPKRLLHIEKETRAVCLPFSHPLIAWRLDSFYRHRGLI